MGGGIAQVAAVNAGKRVVLVDSSPEQLTRATGLMDKLLTKAIDKGKMTAEDKAAALARVETFTDLQALEQADFVVEAATEDTELKLKLFGMIADAAPKHAILASNTSSISITKIAAATDRPEQAAPHHIPGQSGQIILQF